MKIKYINCAINHCEYYLSNCKYNLIYDPRFGWVNSINTFWNKESCCVKVGGWRVVALSDYILHTKSKSYIYKLFFFYYKIIFWINVCVLWIHKDNFIVEKLVWNIDIKVFWYTKLIMLKSFLNIGITNSDWL